MLELALFNGEAAVLSAFFAELGAEATQMLPTMLGVPSHLTAAEDLQIFSIALGVAATDADPPAGFTEVTWAFTQPPRDMVQAWNRLALVQYGDYDTSWLTSVVRVNALEAFAEDPSQDFRGNAVAAQQIGITENVVALAFSALGDDPIAARSALGSIGPMKNVVASVYDNPVKFGTDDELAEAFGLAIEAGTGVHTESPGDHSVAASRFAFDFIAASAQYSVVPRSIKASLAGIAASYSHEVATGARSDDAAFRESSLTEPANFPAIRGLDPAFYLSPDDTYRFLRQFADDNQFTDTLDEEMGRLKGQVMPAAANESQEQFLRAASALGHLAGLEYQAMLKVRGELDQFDRDVREFMQTSLTLGFNNIAGQVTPQGMIARSAWKGFVWGVNKGFPRLFEPTEPSRVDQVEATRHQVVGAQRYEMANYLLNAGWPARPPLPEGLTTDDGSLKPLGDLTEEDKLEEFYNWMDSTDDGDNTIDFAADRAAESFVSGAEFAESISE